MARECRPRWLAAQGAAVRFPSPRQLEMERLDRRTRPSRAQRSSPRLEPLRPTWIAASRMRLCLRQRATSTMRSRQSLGAAPRGRRRPVRIAESEQQQTSQGLVRILAGGTHPVGGIGISDKRSSESLGGLCRLAGPGVFATFGAGERPRQRARRRKMDSHHGLGIFGGLPASAGSSVETTGGKPFMFRQISYHSGTWSRITQALARTPCLKKR